MEYIIPIMLLALVTCSLIFGRDVYDAFVCGAKKALPLIYDILPYMAAMLIALAAFRASGALGIVNSVLSPLMNFLSVPVELTPLIILRPFSGSAAIALLEDVFSSCGVDSYAGLLASVMLGSTETIFYTVALYFGSIRVKRTRHAVITAILSGIIGMAVSVLLCNLML